MFYSPDELRRRLSDWVEWYNNHHYHEALDNVKPVDVYEGRAQQIRRKAYKNNLN